MVRAIPEPDGAVEAELKRQWLRQRAFRTILDVGANEGQFASLARRVFPHARIISFEPLPDCFAFLQARFAEDPNFSAFQMALGREAGECDMHRSEFSPSSSLLPMGRLHREAFPWTATTTRTKVPVRTLDGALEGVAVDGPVLLKLDVQGFETQVLAGAKSTLNACSILLLEASLEQLYEGEPLFDEVYASVRDSGFRLAGFADVLRSPLDNRPLQVDLLFERNAVPAAKVREA